MISLHDFYAILKAMVPLYVAMFLAYGSVRWWNIFTPDQCSGINRFVAIFAVPFLSFHFISLNDPYTMNFRFIAADTLQKIIILVLLALFIKLTKKGSLEWMITIFSLSTLPNSLVIGIPLLRAMYGDLSASLIVQVVALQSIIWYTLLLFLFELHGAKILIMEQFPDSGAAIASIKVDSNVVSLDGNDLLETEAEIGDDGKLHVRVRRSNASGRSYGIGSLSGAEIFSLSSSVLQTPRDSNFNQSDLFSLMGFPGGRLSNFGPAGDLYLAPTRGPTPRRSNSEEDRAQVALNTSSSWSGLYHATQNMTTIFPAVNLEICPAVTNGHQPPRMPSFLKWQNKLSQDHMIARSSSAPVVSKTGQIRTDLLPTTRRLSRLDQDEPSEILADHPEIQEVTETKEFVGRDTERMNSGLDSAAAEQQADGVGVAGKQMPSAGVMIRLILIMVWRKLVRNPNTYASILGLIWSLVSFRWHVEMPKIIGNSISLISNAGLGMAMFSLGLFMALQPKIIACGRSKAMLAMAARFVIGPMVMVLASIVVGLRGIVLQVSIIQASLSQGIVPFVFAKEYNVHSTILSTAVIFGMLITVPITLCYYIVLQCF